MSDLIEHLSEPLVRLKLVYDDGNEEYITVINRASAWILFFVLVYGVDWEGIVMKLTEV